MITASARPSVRLRLAWTVRLLITGFRCAPGATVLVVSAFALATLAAMTCLVVAAGIRDQRTGGSTATTETGAELVAFLRDDLPDSSRDDLARALGQLPGVAGVRVLGSDEALARMRIELGERASVLEGVEEGFLPATLEISLRAGPDGVGRADAIAWRLRRMEGVNDVDVLRTTTDQRLARARVLGWRVGIVGLVLGSATELLALGLAAVAMRRRRADARLLAGLGFTTQAIAAPASIAGAVSALAGSLLGILAGTVALAVVARWWPGTFTLGRVSGGWWAIGGLVTFGTVTLGSLFGWWGARPSTRDWEDLAPADG